MDKFKQQLTENTDNLKKKTIQIGDKSGVNEHIENENEKLQKITSINKVTIPLSKDKDTETTRLEAESGMLKEQNEEIANTDPTNSDTKESFSTISLIHQHPSRFITSNMIDTTTSTSTSKSNSISSIISIPESISFSPHLENASIMKLIIMLVVTLCLTQFFILYRHHIYHFLDKVQSNKVIKTTFYYVF